MSDFYLMRHLQRMMKRISSSGSLLMAWSRYSMATSADPDLSSYMPCTDRGQQREIWEADHLIEICEVVIFINEVICCSLDPD